MVSCQRSQKKMNLLFHLLNAGLIFYLHLAEMPTLAFPPNADLSQGFTAAQVAEKHAWREPIQMKMFRYYMLFAIQQKRLPLF